MVYSHKYKKVRLLDENIQFLKIQIKIKIKNPAGLAGFFIELGWLD
jgi:hypothetical protein